MDNIIIRKIALPMSVRAFTLPDEQGDYNVYINEKLSREQQYKSLSHEMAHIANGDFFRDESATEIEKSHRRI